MSRQLSIQDWELLSAFLDGQLDQKSIQQVEQALSTRPEMKRALQELRHYKSLFKEIPLQRVRRNFTLKPGMVPARTMPRLVPLFRTVSAIAAVLAVILFGIDFLPGLAPLAAAPKAASVAVSENALVGTPAPEIIFWNGQQDFVNNTAPTAPQGLGGGGGGGGGGSAPSVVQPGISSVTVPATPAPTEVPVLAVPLIEKNQPPLSPTPTPPGLTVTQPTAGAADQATRSSGESPILGVPPTQDQGKFFTYQSSNPAASPTANQPLPFLRIVGAILLVLAVVTGIWAWSLPKKR